MMNPTHIHTLPANLLLVFAILKPEEAMLLLVKIASARKISMKEFVQEIKEFISLGIREDSDIRCDSEYSRLETRYRVISENPEADICFLLCSLFPHFAVRQQLEYWTINFCKQGPSTSEEPIKVGKFTIPQYFSFLAFGGLIPSEKGMKLTEGTRKIIIVIHLWCLNSLLETGVPMSHFLMQKHIECSQLANEGRLSELIKLGVLTQSKIPSTLTTAIYESISDEFRKKVNVELRLHSAEKSRIHK
ncbi:unnamed protein product [Bemisia tabaci]|uniref:Uncharacterized protein n=1 Tax=Bemisia tabaci TaxID=7038 RepID=A0A9P0C043_BEMTA|nr:unnamed protein product [Bemisia tabaci]